MLPNSQPRLHSYFVFGKAEYWEKKRLTWRSWLSDMTHKQRCLVLATLWGPLFKLYFLTNGSKNAFLNFQILSWLIANYKFQGGPGKVSSNIHTCFAQVPLQRLLMLGVFLLSFYKKIAGMGQLRNRNCE